MLTAQSEIRPLLNKLWVDFDEIFGIALQSYNGQLIKFWGWSGSPYWLQIVNLSNMGIISCLSQGGLCLCYDIVSRPYSAIFSFPLPFRTTLRWLLQQIWLECLPLRRRSWVEISKWWTSSFGHVKEKSWFLMLLVSWWWCYWNFYNLFFM